MEPDEGDGERSPRADRAVDDRAHGSSAALGYRRAVLFVTGAATLALQLIASRILTPYFGVSLYIWTGILVVTLIALAAGYALGGRASDRRSPAHSDGLFGLAPAMAGAMLAVGALVYPDLFPLLARLDLAVGAILAAAILLGPALVLLAAMNPLLVAANRREVADAGAGGVFAWSTAGSVLGVLFAAFALIPYFTNFSSLLLVAVVMAVVSVVWASFSRQKGGVRARAVKSAAVALMLTALSQVMHHGIPGMTTPSQARGFQTVSVAPSALGTVRVVDLPSADGQTDRVMLIDGMNMGMQRVRENGVGPASIGFPHALTGIARLRPWSQRILVMGLGIGSAPMMLAGDGRSVDVVEISPTVTAVAREHFGFDPRRAPVHQMDARIFARHCPGDDGRRYDVILVDLFVGDGIPDHLVTREFFIDLRTCLTPGGTVAFNTLVTQSTRLEDTDLLATISDVFGMTTVIDDIDPNARIGNAYIVSPPLVDPAKATFDEAPAPLDARLRAAFAEARRVGIGDLGDGQVLTDERNRFSVTARRDEMTYRRQIVESLPPALLLN